MYIKTPDMGPMYIETPYIGLILMESPSMGPLYTETLYTTILNRSGARGNGNEGILHILLSPRTGASSYQGYSLFCKGGLAFLQGIQRACNCARFWVRVRARTHTHTHTHIYIYIVWQKYLLHFNCHRCNVCEFRQVVIVAIYCFLQLRSWLSQVFFSTMINL